MTKKVVINNFCFKFNYLIFGCLSLIYSYFFQGFNTFIIRESSLIVNKSLDPLCFHSLILHKHDGMTRPGFSLPSQLPFLKHGSQSS